MPNRNHPFPARTPTTSEIAQLKIRAKQGDQVAQHALRVLDQLSQGGVPIGGTPQAPPGFKMVDMGNVKPNPLPCGACGSKLFEKMNYFEAFYDENEPAHEWYGKPTMITLCAKCGSEQVITAIHRQTDDKNEPEVRYEYSTRTFKYGMQQIQQIMAEHRIQILNQVAEIIDETFGKTRESLATELMTKIVSVFEMKDTKGGSAAATEPQPVPAPAEAPVEAPAKSSIITEV
jgi:hypothetical protein